MLREAKSTTSVKTTINRRLLPLHLHKTAVFVKSVVVVNNNKKKKIYTQKKNNIGSKDAKNQHIESKRGEVSERGNDRRY
jgi:hypothetical protein